MNRVTMQVRKFAGRVVPMVAGVGLCLALGSQSAHAVSVVGGQLFSTGGSLTVDVLHSSSGYTSSIYLLDPTTSAPLFIGYDDFPTTVTFGPYASGQELIFGIAPSGGPPSYFTGPASRNPDGVVHSAVDMVAPGTAVVGFEDLWGGGDMDFDDAIIRVSGDISPSSTPEPASMSLLGLGFGGFMAARRRRKQAQA